MRLDLSATSQKNIGYAPNTICIEFTDNENNHHELTMDIQGASDYNPSTLNVLTKGELIPWMHRLNGHISDLDELSEDKYEPYLQLFNEHLKTATKITIDIYAVDDEQEEDSYDDVLTNLTGSYEYVDDQYKSHEIPFTFKYEIV